MNTHFDKQRSLVRAHCLNRLAKLQAKLAEPNWDMDAGKEIALLMQIQVALTEMLDDIGVKCYVIEDLEIAAQMERSS